MKKGNIMQDVGLAAFWVGMFLIIGSHMYMALYGLSEGMLIPHVLINFVGAGMAIMGWEKS